MEISRGANASSVSTSTAGSLLFLVSIFLSISNVVESFTSSPVKSATSPCTSSRANHDGRTQSTFLKNSLFDEEEEEVSDDEDDEDFIDTTSLGDWRTFRRNLALVEKEQPQDGTAQELSESSFPKTTTKKPKSVSKENEEILLQQNEDLAKEYITGVWAHEVYTPEVGGLVVRMPLEAELFKNYKRSLIGRRLKQLVDGNGEVPVEAWYARAKTLVEDEMKKIADSADEEGQIDATRLNADSSEMLSLFLDNQENWQEVCLVVEKENSKSKTVVLNRPMAFKLTDNIGRLVLNGAFQELDLKIGERKDLTRFMMAFSSECAVYVGGPDEQNSRALMIHGIPDLPGAVELSPGSNIYQGGVDAAVKGVLEGEYSPLEFRFFVGCHLYDESALDVAVHLGKYQPIACARSVALKQCISLPKPLWHEVMELCGGDLGALSTLELSKGDDMQFQVVDETEYDIPDELGELDNFDDEDDDYYL